MMQDQRFKCGILAIGLMLLVGCSRSEEAAREDGNSPSPGDAATTTDVGDGTSPTPPFVMPPDDEPSRLRVVYLIDASGSMGKKMPYAHKLVADSVIKLDESQSFAVLRYTSGQVQAFPEKGLTHATKKAKGSVLQWLKAREGNAFGSGDPLLGLNNAIAREPGHVYLVTDTLGGRHRPKTEKLTALARDLASGRPKARLNIFQLMSETDTNVLKVIAEASGGTLKVVTKEDAEKP